MRPAASAPPVIVHLMPALTGIRFPLALWVVTNHLSGRGRMFGPLTTASPAAFALMDNAWVALTVFFAISGFVLARRYYATAWDGPTLVRYAVARFARIYPVYLISLLILVPIISAELRSGALGPPAGQAGLVLNHILILQGWRPPIVNWNTPAWSLTCEVFFYALFPIVIVLLRRPTWPRLAAAAAFAFALPVALRMQLDPPIAKPLLYFGDFLIGVAAGRFYDRMHATGIVHAWIGPWLYGPAIAGGLLLVLYRNALGSFLVFDAGIRLTSVVLVFGLACGGGALWRWLSSPLMVAGGGAAYAIYILHVPVLWWYERSDLRTALPPVVAGVVYIAMVVALSVIVWRQIELPANGIIRRWLSGPAQSRPVVADATPAAKRIGET